MHCIVNILFIFFVLRVIGGVPSGLKIVSSRAADIDEYPFIVTLERQITLAFATRIEAENVVQLCTCAVLTPFWTLTAGHCIDSVGPVKDLTDNVKIKSVIRYGAQSNTTADVTSTIRYPNFKDRLLELQNDIGLIRTDKINLKQYARVSALDISMFESGEKLTLVGYESYKSPWQNSTDEDSTSMRKPLDVANAVVERHDEKNVSTFGVICNVKRCNPSSINTCPGDSGGPLLHQTGVIGINSISMENFRLCSLTNKNRIVELRAITPIKPYITWINFNIKRDALLLNVDDFLVTTPK